MFRLFRINDDSYIISTAHGAISGNRLNTANVLSTMGVNWKDIEDSLVELQLNDFHVAEFGIRNTYLYSKRIT